MRVPSNNEIDHGGATKDKTILISGAGVWEGRDRPRITLRPNGADQREVGIGGAVKFKKEIWRSRPALFGWDDRTLTRGAAIESHVIIYGSGSNVWLFPIL